MIELDLPCNSLGVFGALDIVIYILYGIFIHVATEIGHIEDRGVLGGRLPSNAAWLVDGLLSFLLVVELYCLHHRGEVEAGLVEVLGDRWLWFVIIATKLILV